MQTKKIDEEFAAFIRWLQERGLEAHTDRKGKTTIVVKTPRPVDDRRSLP